MNSLETLSFVRRAFFLVGLTVLFPWALSAQSYRELSERAVQATEQDSLELAERYIREALKLEPANPHNALLFSNLGTIQRRRHQYDLALESYTYALNIAPRTSVILLNRATLYMEMGKTDAARADYSLVLDLDADNAEALWMRAYIYMQHRDYKMARADYKHLLRLHPDDFKARLGLATLSQKEKKYEEAFTLLNQMIQEGLEGASKAVPSQLALLYVARAGVEKEMNHLDLALLDLEEAIRLDSSQADAYLIRGQIYLSQGKKRLAKDDFQEAMNLGVPSSELRDLLKQCK